MNYRHASNLVAAALTLATVTASLTGFAPEAKATDILHKLAAVSHLQAQDTATNLNGLADDGKGVSETSKPERKTPPKK